MVSCSKRGQHEVASAAPWYARSRGMVATWARSVGAQSHVRKQQGASPLPRTSSRVAPTWIEGRPLRAMPRVDAWRTAVAQVWRRAGARPRQCTISVSRIRPMTINRGQVGGRGNVAEVGLSEQNWDSSRGWEGVLLEKWVTSGREHSTLVCAKPRHGRKSTRLGAERAHVLKQQGPSPLPWTSSHLAPT
jgi:hypothetical protein